MSDETVEERRAARLAELAQREADDRAQAADDARLDLPVLTEFSNLVNGEMKALTERLDALAANLVRRVATDGNGLPFQVHNMGLVRANLATVAERLALEAGQIIAAAEQD